MARFDPSVIEADECGIAHVDRRCAVSYFGAMIRSFLTILATLALLIVSLTASAQAMTMDDDVGHSPTLSFATPLGEASFIPACDGMGELACAFACAGMAKPVAGDHPGVSCAYGTTAFFLARTPFPAGYGPEQAERPPRLLQL